MNKSLRTGIIAAVTILSCLKAIPANSQRPVKKEKPNIIFIIMSDDHAYQAISGYN